MKKQKLTLDALRVKSLELPKPAHMETVKGGNVFVAAPVTAAPPKGSCITSVDPEGCNPPKEEPKPIRPIIIGVQIGAQLGTAGT